MEGKHIFFFLLIRGWGGKGWKGGVERGKGGRRRVKRQFRGKGEASWGGKTRGGKLDGFFLSQFDSF